MASLLKRPRSKFWHAYYRDSSGRAFCRSTKLCDRKAAQKVADLWETTAQREKRVQHVRATFADIIRDAYREAIPMVTVRQYVEIWLGAKKPETAASTFVAYRKTCDSFIEFLAERAERDVSDISRVDIVSFRNELAGKLSTDTVNRYVKILRMVFKSARRDGYIFENPAEHVEILKNRGTGALRRPFTVAEIKAVLAVADAEWQSIIKFGLYTGQRLADIARLTWGNIDLQRKEIRLTARKTDKRLTIPIAAPLHAHILTLEGGDSPIAPLHPRAYRVVEKQGRANTLSNWFAELLVNAGLRPKLTHQSRGIGRDGKRAANELSFHSLRHTAVSLLKDAGIPQAVVQELVGHESEAISALYTHVGKEALEKAVSALPAL
jgi:integrase